MARDTTREGINEGRGRSLPTAPPPFTALFEKVLGLLLEGLAKVEVG